MQRFVSNRMEVLVANLAAHLAEDPADPMEPELVLVQSQGMERWLSMELARWLGIAAHIQYLFPSALLFRLFSKVMTVPETPTFDIGTLHWSCHRALGPVNGEGDTDSVFAEVAAYLDGEDEIKRFQLAGAMADLFDQYLLFRPEMMLAWENGEEDHWQAAIWREIVANAKGPHRVHLMQKLDALLEANDPVLEHLPRRISIFGISALPPFYLSFLEKIAPFTEIRWYLLDPCEEYWGDLRTELSLEREARMAEEMGILRSDLHQERGNPLLASFGKAGQAFFRMLAASGTPEFRHSDPPGDATLLHRLQTRILKMEEGRDEEERFIVDPADDSIRIHVCHSPMREMEVLRDQVLAMISGEDPVLFREILVMLPDIAAYAPYIDAVFGRPLADGGRIPYTIADRSVRMESRIAETFLSVVRLAGSRFSASSVLDVLESPAVSEKFGLGEEDLEQIREWVADTRIRWGVDGRFKSGFDLPETRANTWAAGRDRLVLGMAMGDDGAALPGGILPYDRMGPSAAFCLSAFLSFTDLLFSLQKEATHPRSPAEWVLRLQGLVEALFVENRDTEREIAAIRNALDRIRTETTTAGLADAVPLAIVTQRLSDLLDGGGFGGGFLNGGLTFCAMVPMRCIPFSVICLCGMNDGVYPRQGRQPGFDLMAKDPRPGDRSRRDDDRYLFLEILISVRTRLLITYTGRSIQDDAVIPPSVLVSELVDDLVATAMAPEKGDLEKLLRVHHPLQPFSPALFTTDDPGKNPLFSFSRIHRDVAAALQHPEDRLLSPFIQGEIPLVPAEKEEADGVALEDLFRFFRDPAAFFLTRRLEMHLGYAVDDIRDRETFLPDGIDAFSIRKMLCESELKKKDPDLTRKRLAAAGKLPQGSPGERAVEMLAGEAGMLARAVEEEGYVPMPAAGPVLHRFTVDGIRVSGTLPDPGGEGELFWRPAAIRGQDRLFVWMRYLIRMQSGMAASATLVGLEKGKVKRIHLGVQEKTVETEALLGDLIRIYLAARTTPVPFFPEISFTWIRKCRMTRGGSPETAFREVEKNWADPARPWVGPGGAAALLWRDQDPFGDGFAELANRVYLPVLSATGEVKL